jgi:hypothetical protein
MDSTLLPAKFTPRKLADQLAITCSVIAGVAWITVALRFYTRIFILRRVGKDDFAILISLVSTHLTESSFLTKATDMPYLLLRSVFISRLSYL